MVSAPDDPSISSSKTQKPQRPTKFSSSLKAARRSSLAWKSSPAFHPQGPRIGRSTRPTRQTPSVRSLGKRRHPACACGGSGPASTRRAVRASRQPGRPRSPWKCRAVIDERHGKKHQTRVEPCIMVDGINGSIWTDTWFYLDLSRYINRTINGIKMYLDRLQLIYITGHRRYRSRTTDNFSLVPLWCFLNFSKRLPLWFALACTLIVQIMSFPFLSYLQATLHSSSTVLPPSVGSLEGVQNLSTLRYSHVGFPHGLDSSPLSRRTQVSCGESSATAPRNR